MSFSSPENALRLRLPQHTTTPDENSGAIVIPESLRHAWHPATHSLWEWTNYALHCDEADELRVGSRRISPLAPGLFWLRFENQLGLAEVQAMRAERPFGSPLWVEVLSPKFATAEAHHSFWNALVDEVFERLAFLPFAFETPTTVRVQPGHQSTLAVPSSLWTWHFFVSCGHELQRALARVEAQPHRTGRAEWERVPLWEHHIVDAEVCLDIIRSPDEWLPAAPHARGYPIVQRLKGRLPQSIGARLIEETLDTPLNRWLCGAVQIWLEAARSLKAQIWWNRVPIEKKCRVQDIENALQHTLQAFAAVQNSSSKVLSPGTMQSLLRRAGYAEVWRLWQQFHQVPQPFWEHCRNAIEVRDVATLYEVWAFFALGEAIGVALNVTPRWELRTSDVVGLHSRSVARFGNNRSLIYNRRTRGYSTIMQPDFTWLDGDTLIVFDAKFRLDRLAVAPDQSTLDSATVTHDDLWTMHAYRDALRARAAVAIYPGEASAFYDVGGSIADDGDSGQLLRQIMQGQRQGIGALAMQPVARH